MPLRAADSCGLGGRKGNAPQFGGFVFVGHQQPGVRRSWTGDFEELRALYRRRSRELVGARLASLQQIVASRDSPGLGTFLETGRKIPPGSPEVCAWCNKRIALRPSPGSREFPALTCQVCLRWHCEKCRADKVDMTFFAVSSASRSGGSSPGTQKANSPGQMSHHLESCGTCASLIAVLRWHQAPLNSVLASSARYLLDCHRRLRPQMTAFATSLAQFEGLVRTLELQREHGSELQEALTASSDQANAAETQVEAILRMIEAVQCKPLPHRDIRIRDALLRHGRTLLESSKPRLRAAMMRYKPRSQGRLPSPAPREPSPVPSERDQQPMLAKSFTR